MILFVFPCVRASFPLSVQKETQISMPYSHVQQERTPIPCRPQQSSVPDTYDQYDRNGIFGASEIPLILLDSFHWTGTRITAGIFGSNFVFMGSSVQKTQSGEEILFHDNADVPRVSAVCTKIYTMGRIGSRYEIFDLPGKNSLGPGYLSVALCLRASTEVAFFFG